MQQPINELIMASRLGKKKAAVFPENLAFSYQIGFKMNYSKPAKHAYESNHYPDWYILRLSGLF